MNNQFELLENFLSGTFHQNIDLEYPNKNDYVEAVINHFTDKKMFDYMERIIQEIRNYLSSNISVEEKLLFITDNVDIVLEPYFKNSIDFLLYLHKRFQEEIDKSKR